MKVQNDIINWNIFRDKDELCSLIVVRFNQWLSSRADGKFLFFVLNRII